MKTISENGKFELSCSDECTMGSIYVTETSTEIANVEIRLIKNEKVFLSDLAKVIFLECFDPGMIPLENGLHLNHDKLRCYVVTNKNEYVFEVFKAHSMHDLTLALAGQISI